MSFFKHNYCLCSAGLQGPRYSLLHQHEEVWLCSKPWTRGELGVRAALLAESLLWTARQALGCALRLPRLVRVVEVSRLTKFFPCYFRGFGIHPSRIPVQLSISGENHPCCRARGCWLLSVSARLAVREGSC